MDEQWFSASMRIVCLIEHDGATSQDECVHIFRADGWDGALRRAIELGRSHERDYVNADGDRVRWRLDRVMTLDMLRAEQLDGAEVFSSPSDVSGGSSFETQFHPEEHQPDQTGI
jgi:hypothetical protein